MLKKILCITIVFLSCQLISAQKPFQPETAFGINSGITLSRVSFSSMGKGEPLGMYQQFSGGVTYRYIVQKNVGLQAELNYSLRGWQYKQDDESMQRHPYTRSLAYIELPFMTHAYYDLSKRMRFIFLVGPQINYLIGDNIKEKVILDSDDTDAPVPGYFNLDKVNHKFDYGIVGGAGLELRTGIGSFVLEGRYYFGLGDTFNNTRGDIYQRSNHQVIGIKLSYLFH